MPGGEKNIKSMYIKSTNTIAVPIYMDTNTNMNDISVDNNMTPRLIKKSKKMNVKRLKKSATAASVKCQGKSANKKKSTKALQNKKSSIKKIKNLID